MSSPMLDSVKTKAKEFAAFYLRYEEFFAYFLLFCVQLIWSSLQLIARDFMVKKLMKGDTLAFVRIWISVPCCFLTYMIAEYRREDRGNIFAPFKNTKNIVLLIGAAICGNAGLLVMIGYAYAQGLSPAAGGTILAMQVLLLPIFAAMVKEGKLKWYNLLGCALGLAGVVIVMDPTSFDGKAWGFTIMFVNAISYSWFFLINKWFLGRTKIGMGASQLVVAITAGLLLLVFAGWHVFADLKENWSDFTTTDWLTILYMGTVGSSFGYTLNSYCISRTRSPSVFAALQTVVPISNTVFGTVFYDEPFRTWEVCGVATVVLALLLVMLARRKELQNAKLQEGSSSDDVELGETGKEQAKDPENSVVDPETECREDSDSVEGVEELV